MSSEDVRAAVWARLTEQHGNPALRLSAWQQAEVTKLIPDDAWAAEHAGTCVTCQAEAHLYPGGWYCDTHRPSTPSPKGI